jgi:hypothetical protein
MDRLPGGLGEAGQAPARTDGVAHLLPAVTVPVEVPVGQHHPGTAGSQRGERDLDLAGAAGIGLDLPLQVDVPAEADPGGRLVGQDPGPPALAAVGAAVDDVAADVRLEDHLGQRGGQDVLVVVPPGADLLGEDPEGVLGAGIDVDFGADRGGIGLRGHECPLSAACRKFCSERFQNCSK